MFTLKILRLTVASLKAASNATHLRKRSVAKISSKDMPICMENLQLPFRRKKLYLFHEMSLIAVFEIAYVYVLLGAHPVPVHESIDRSMSMSM